MKNGKQAYICGPLTELPAEDQAKVKQFYTKIGDLIETVSGTRAFVPHEHYDPVKNPSFTPDEVDRAERRQVCEHTSLLLVVAIAPSWGGGIEVEMANQNNVPVWLLCPEVKLLERKISRLLRGNPAVREVIPYFDEVDALDHLRVKLQRQFVYV